MIFYDFYVMQYFADKPRNIWISRICQALAHARTAPLAVGLAGVTQLMDDGFSFSVCVLLGKHGQTIFRD